MITFRIYQLLVITSMTFLFKSNPMQVITMIFLLSVILPAMILAYHVLNPTILKYPWPKAKSGKKDDTTVVFAGSFNPPHNGHLVMVEYLAKIYEEVILVIGMNKNKTYKVSPATRAHILERMVSTLGLKNVRVKVVSGLIWRYAMSQNAKILFRGIRTWEKDGMDEKALHILNSWGPIVLGPLKWPLRTYFMEGNPKYLHLSSTLIRDACIGQSGKMMDGMVPKEVQDDIAKAYR